MLPEIRFPHRSGTSETEAIEHTNRIVIVGANGSGKTRLGIHIEQTHQKRIAVHRISAQKALDIPEYAKLLTLEQAEKDLIYGRSDQHAAVDRKIHDRWGGAPATFLLSDYDKVLSLLFAKSADRDRKHAEETRTREAYIPVKDAPIDTITLIWRDIMPHREIKFIDGKVLVRKAGEPEYHGKEMSDGERVALYLIGQCLCAPDGSVLIIDEPELHLHKALINKIWDKVEELCPTKVLIYITHDLDFAASRCNATKIWVKSYDGRNSWTWGRIPEHVQLPESLLLEVIGSRKRVIFCEGSVGGLDATIYQAVYPEYHVIPRGGCDKVIESTKALRNNEALHHLSAMGIVDGDHRDAREVAALLEHGIHTIGVAEIENLLCMESVIRLVAKHFSKEPGDVVNSVTEFVRSALRSEFEAQISARAERRVRFFLSGFTKAGVGKAGLEAGLGSLIQSLSIDAIYAEITAQYSSALAATNIDDILRVYNRKSLAARIGKFFGLESGQYRDLVLRLLKGPKREELTLAFKAQLPVFE